MKALAARQPSELQIQLGFRNRLRIVAPAVHVVAVPNAAKRSQWAATRAKLEGLATGFPDVMALAAGKVAFLEFKSVKGKLDDNQAEWQERLSRWGFPCGVFRSVDSAVEFLRAWDFPFIDQPFASARGLG